MTSLKLVAPSGHYRAIGVDTFDGADWIIGDYTTQKEAEAEAAALKRCSTMLMTYVYDDKGRCLYSAGSY